MNSLRIPGEEQFRPELTAADLERLWGRVDDARKRRGSVRAQLPRLTLAAAGVCVVALATMLWLPRSGVLTAEGVSLEPGARLEIGPRGIEFGDDSRIASLGTAAQAQILANEPERFALALRSGSVQLHVTPGGPRRWEVQTDLATVEVVGTIFDVSLTPTSLVVRVVEGTVEVRGERVAGRTVRLGAGQVLEVPGTSRSEDPSQPRKR